MFQETNNVPASHVTANLFADFKMFPANSMEFVALYLHNDELLWYPRTSSMSSIYPKHSNKDVE